MDLARRLSSMRGGNFHALYTRGIVGCTERNHLIRDIAHDLMNQRYRVLILVDWVLHGKKLQELIPEAVFIEGKTGDRIKELLCDLDSGKVRCVIGSPVIGEGLDIPAADAVIYAKGLKAKVTHTQDIFRVLTAHNQKRRALIIDFCDRHQETLMQHAAERLHNYLSMGCEIKVLDNCRAFKVDPQLRLTQ
jgi:superfamily II DNA or RNA helicase